jgi:hypothetical protein
LVEQRKWEQSVAPLVVTLREVTLGARAVAPIETEPGLELLYVVSGELSVHDPPEPGELTNPLAPTLDGAGHPITVGAAAKGTFQPGSILRAGAGDGAVLLLLTVTPDGAAAKTAERATRFQPDLIPQPLLATDPMVEEGRWPGATRLPSVLLEGAASCI